MEEANPVTNLQFPFVFGARVKFWLPVAIYDFFAFSLGLRSWRIRCMIFCK